MAMQLLIPDFGGFMSRLKIALPTLLLVGGFVSVLFVNTTPSFGKKEYTASTKKACTYCHKDVAKNAKELTDAGKYYGEHKALPPEKK